MKPILMMKAYKLTELTTLAANHRSSFIGTIITLVKEKISAPTGPPTYYAWSGIPVQPPLIMALCNLGSGTPDYTNKDLPIQIRVR